MKAPAINLDLSGVLGIAAVLGLGALGIYLYTQRKKIGTALNPTSDKNIAYTTVNSIGANITGNKDFSLGSWLYDLTHKASDINSPVVLPPTATSSPADAVAAGTAAL